MRPGCSEMQAYPFEGLRVLDFGIGAAGVEAGRFFSEWGADVLKVESTAQLDFLRVTVGSMMNPLFASSSRTKRSVGINSRTPEGLELVHRLVELSDVLIENSRAGALDRIGLGWERLHDVNPRLIMLSSQLLGSRGPWSGWAGYGPNVGAVAGLTYLWNHPEDGDPPVGVSTIYPDHLIGRLLALAGAAALHERNRTGIGVHVEVAQFEAVIGMMGDILLAESLESGSAAPQGNRRERGVPWGVYACSGMDSWLAVTVRSDAEWSRLVEALDRPEWTAGLDTHDERLRRRTEIDDALSLWARGRQASEAMAHLQGHGIAAAAVHSPLDQLDDPQIAFRGFLRPVDQPELGTVIFEGPAFVGDALPQPIVRRAPRLGEHTRVVCGELLGLTNAEMEDLFARGVLEEQTSQLPTA
jgi:crotonobetainyl-CoA:carnitine CoA-transferase CaiB-like acyl-CoA transferase